MNGLWDMGREDLAHFVRARPAGSAVLLIPRVHVPCRCGAIWKESDQAFQRYKMFWQKVLLQQRNNLPNSNSGTFCAKFIKILNYILKAILPTEKFN